MMYFVILRHQNGKPVPMVGDDGEIAIFETLEDADECAANNPLGETYGYEVFAW